MVASPARDHAEGRLEALQSRLLSIHSEIGTATKDEMVFAEKRDTLRKEATEQASAEDKTAYTAVHR